MILARLLVFLPALGLALLAPLAPQTNTFNSVFALSAAQIRAVNLSAADAASIAVAARFERSNWATGSVLVDPFYAALPAAAAEAPPGAVLRIEARTDTSRYTLAPGLALSRIIYQSRALNGSNVPVSAFVLWPYQARDRDRAARTGPGADDESEPAPAPLVSWGHGTSGLVAECAPSHIRNLWYQFSAPYALALAGYAVVGSDYAGLGVPLTPGDAAPITHQYLASPAAGNDLLYAAQAAHAAFPHALTEDFAVMGHSQGGGAAWAAAQQQLEAGVPGYLGAIAASPVTNSLEMAVASGSSLGLLQVAKSMASVFEDLSLSDILTPAGIAALGLIEDIKGCNSVFEIVLAALIDEDPTRALTRDDFLLSPHAQRFANLTVAGGRDFAGPLLVLQGTADSTVPEEFTTKYVNKTCQEFPDSELHYVKARAVDHVPVLYATQQVWINWLDETFASAGKTSTYGRSICGCTVQEIGRDAPMPLDHYQGNLNYFLEYSLDAYQVA